MKGFDISKSIYYLTYNRSTPEVDDYLLTKVKTIRTTGQEGITVTGMNNEAEMAHQIYNCSWHGPDNCGEHLLTTLKQAEKLQPKVFMYMLHGLDNEVWGPIHAHTLEHALDYIIESPWLDYVDTSSL